jgi:hypothetical protein
MLLIGGRIKLPQPPTEAQEIVVRQVLTSEQQCRIPVPGALDLLKGIVG